jgi:hypothetical protein
MEFSNEAPLLAPVSNPGCYCRFFKAERETVKETSFDAGVSLPALL